MKPIPFQRWEHAWKKLPLEYTSSMPSVLKIENDKMITRLDGYMKKRRFCNYCKRKIVSIYLKLQEKAEDEQKEEYGCDFCLKDKCYCKKCGTLTNVSIADFANTFAQHQNKKLNKECNKQNYEHEITEKEV